MNLLNFMAFGFKVVFKSFLLFKNGRPVVGRDITQLMQILWSRSIFFDGYDRKKKFL